MYYPFKKNNMFIKNQSEIYKIPFLKYILNIISALLWGISTGAIIIFALIGLFLILRIVGGHSLIDSLRVLNSEHSALGTQMLTGIFI